jgi:hypothetical protein
MEHETTVPDVAERHGARPIEPARKAADPEISPAEQSAAGTRGTALRPSVVIGLQRSAGNAAVAALVQRSRAATEEQEETSPVLDVVGKGRGRPLDPDLKAEMEGRLGSDFSDVRVHTDPDAAKSAAAVSARAYTVGNEVVLGADAPALDSAQGKRTLAHELTHVDQQRRGPVAGTPTKDGISISDPSDRFEQAAEANAERAMAGQAVDPNPSPTHDAGSPGTPASAQRAVTDVSAGEDEEEAAAGEEDQREIEEGNVEAGEMGAEANEEEAAAEAEDQEDFNYGDTETGETETEGQEDFNNGDTETGETETEGQGDFNYGDTETEGAEEDEEVSA